MNPLEALLADLPEPDSRARAAVETRAAAILRPAGAFARLDAVAVWLAGWQGRSDPAVRRPRAIVFAADHGVAVEGVSAAPSEVTVAIVAALRDGAATAAVLAGQVGAELDVVDVGVGRPSGNIRVEPALDEDRFAAAVAAGVAAVDAAADADLLVFGEMGIGNTTPAAAVATALFGGDASLWVGPGTGLGPSALAHKVEVVAESVRRAGPVAPLDTLVEVGGAELVAIAAATGRARYLRIPVLLDGFIVTAAVAPLAVHRPGALDHCLAGHCSAEPGHRLLLDRLGLDPLVQLDLRLGEGAGALVALPLVRAAAAAVTDVATFAEWGLD